MAREGLDIARLLREGAGPAQGEGEYDFSARDFLGFEVSKPARMAWHAAGEGGVARLTFTLKAKISAECVRCLVPFCAPVLVEKQYDMTPEELVGEYPEYPTLRDGVLDLEELAYGELVLEVSPVPVCREDCPGLCAACGRPKDCCVCGAPAEAAEGATAPDPRWQALRDLLQED